MSSDVWIYVQENLAKITKVCSYDRMGLGFSKRLMQNESTGTEKVWGMSTTGRMVDDLHRLLEAAQIAKPFILVGSELGALNSRFYSHIHDVQVSDLVLIDPIPEDVFEEERWKEYWAAEKRGSKTTVTVITGDRFDHEIPDQLNQMVAALQKKFLEASYPSANHIHIKGADRQMIHMQPSAVFQHLRRLVNQRQGKQQSQ
ncbi:unnamed protein product [Tetraodon nigroviridis]|uniref:(spotted green pufferfish) hypothetical protein n=1 Tax=Tetraodon nigroviridis TaxID=99883 RepID=Q4SMS1_TETNG|nr:unnamed protein product [Tetraodon nigroviridis]